MGSFAWAQRASGTGFDGANALAVSGTSVYAAGYFASHTAGFSAITLTNPNLNTNLGFLAALTDATLTAKAAGRALAPATLYPNPARHTATLRLPAGTVPAPLTLTDALGRAVCHYPAPAGPEAALDLLGLPAGLYLLRGAGPAQRLLVE
nr:T9SS type A sorting domain-containing protein [Hymenobacter terricola]